MLPSDVGWVLYVCIQPIPSSPTPQHFPPALRGAEHSFMAALLGAAHAIAEMRDERPAPICAPNPNQHEIPKSHCPKSKYKEIYGEKQKFQCISPLLFFCEEGKPGR